MFAHAGYGNWSLPSPCARQGERNSCLACLTFIVLCRAIVKVGGAGEGRKKDFFRIHAPLRKQLPRAGKDREEKCDGYERPDASGADKGADEGWPLGPRPRGLAVFAYSAGVFYPLFVRELLFSCTA